MNRLEEWLSHAVVKQRLIIIIALLFIAALAGSGIRFLTFSNDSRMFFSKENPQLQALEALEETYSRIENVLFVIAPHSGNIFERKTLAAIEELSRESWQIPYSSRVDSIANFQHTRAEEDDLVVEDLVQNALTLSDQEIESIRKMALHEPLLVNSLISKSGHVAGVNVNIVKPENNRHATQEVSVASQALVLQIKEKYPSLDIYLCGGVPIDNAFEVASKQEMTSMIPLMFVVLLAILAISLRSVLATAGTFLVFLSGRY